MTSEPIVVIAALVVLGLLLNWLFKVLQPTILTALAIAGIFLCLQLLFGVSPEAFSQQVAQFPEQLWELGKQFFRANSIVNLS